MKAPRGGTRPSEDGRRRWQAARTHAALARHFMAARKPCRSAGGQVGGFLLEERLSGQDARAPASGVNRAIRLLAFRRDMRLDVENEMASRVRGGLGVNGASALGRRRPNWWSGFFPSRMNYSQIGARAFCPRSGLGRAPGGLVAGSL